MGAGWRVEGDEQAHRGLFALHDADEVADRGDGDVTALDLDDDPVGGALGAVYAMVCASALLGLASGRETAQNGNW